MSDINERLALAARQHQAGRFDEAEKLYRGIIEVAPRHAIALQCLGILGLQTGRPALTIEALGQALAIDERMPECHHNLALALRAAGRLDEAIAHYRRAIALKPDHVEAHVNLANALAQQDRFEEAIASYRRALDLKPDLAQAHNNLGIALLSQGRLEDALSHLRRALTLDPSLVEASLSIGDALLAQGRLEEAAAQFQRALVINPNSPQANQRRGLALLMQQRPGEAVTALDRAIALKPDFVEAHNSLAQALFNLRRIDEALNVLRRAIDVGGATSSKFLFIQLLRSRNALPDNDDMRKLIARALTEPWDRIRNVEPIAVGLLKQDSSLREFIARAVDAWPRRLSESQLLGIEGLSATCRQSLFVELLKSTPICDVELERFLTALRSILLETALRATPSVPPDTQLLQLCCAVAGQCFLNEYVFAQLPEEHAQATHLVERLCDAIVSNSGVCELWLAVSAAYVPLHSLPVARALLDRKWSAPVTELLVRQVREPQEEETLCQSIPHLTAIEDTVSRAVQQQYEENPYPRWIKAEPASKPVTVDQLLRSKFPLSRFRNLGKVAVDILVAGCGTGQQPFEFAQQLAHTRMLAVDLSRASLAYARRKALSGALASVDYAQADILQLASIGRKFDLIVASGVLHHMHDPFAGWRALLALLQPAGVMYVGLYSELARGEVKAARTFIAERGYRATRNDIRQCRQEILSLPEGSLEKNVVRYSDFFTLSECRDLLFHVQEHRHTLPQIADFLSEHGLEFLGFDLHPVALQQYAARFPSDGAMVDLSLWNTFEQENPDTFVGMYQFWVQKTAL